MSLIDNWLNYDLLCGTRDFWTAFDDAWCELLSFCILCTLEWAWLAFERISARYWAFSARDDWSCLKDDRSCLGDDRSCPQTTIDRRCPGNAFLLLFFTIDCAPNPRSIMHRGFCKKYHRGSKNLSCLGRRFKSLGFDEKHGVKAL